MFFAPGAFEVDNQPRGLPAPSAGTPNAAQPTSFASTQGACSIGSYLDCLLSGTPGSVVPPCSTIHLRKGNDIQLSVVL
jgi:hypothetical protein